MVFNFPDKQHFIFLFADQKYDQLPGQLSKYYLTAMNSD